MSALPPKADMCSATAHVRFVPIADINDMSGAAATAGERGVSLSACVLQRWRHSTGSHCRSHDCPPKYCLCGSNLRTSHTGSPNSYYLSLIGSPRTRGPGKPGPAVDQIPKQQQRRESCGPSSISVVGADNNTNHPVSIPNDQLFPAQVFIKRAKSAAHTSQPCELSRVVN